MSARLRGGVKWGSSSDEDTCDAKYVSRVSKDPRQTVQQQPSLSEENDTTTTESRRRGRGPSKRPCLNRNALMARENRQRKKAYLEKIENKLSYYQQENKTLVNTIRKQGIDIKRLSGEVAYLRSVLNNNTSITALLRTINDGLHKINAHKRNNITNGALVGQTEPDQRNGCACPTANPKENLPRTPLNNNAQYVNSTADRYTLDYNNVAHGQLNGDVHGAMNGGCNCKSPVERKIQGLMSDFDHTYTVSKTPVVDVKSELDSRDVSNTLTTTSSMSQMSDDSYADTVKDLDSIISISQANLSDIGDKKDTEALNAEFDQLPSFSMDIFDDLPKCDDIIDSIDCLQDASTLFNGEDAFQNLDNTGICLHVNSDKVSLEFCSVCHLNSKNSGLH